MLFLDQCENLLPLIRLIKNGIIPLIQIGIPIILILLGMLDLGKAVVASKEDEIKAAQKLLVKRAIYALAIFFVVLIVQVVFGVSGGQSPLFKSVKIEFTSSLALSSFSDSLGFVSDGFSVGFVSGVLFPGSVDGVSVLPEPLFP